MEKIEYVLQHNDIILPEFHSFSFDIFLKEIPHEAPNASFELHSHEECEIYINIEGNVSFMVEDSLYPISAGDIIIARPHEAHLCVYHDNSYHKHYWILFSCEKNEEFFDIFFNRNLGENNLICLSPEKNIQVKELCERLLTEPLNSFERYLNILQFIQLLRSGYTISEKYDPFSFDFCKIISYINLNISQPITILSLAEHFNISCSTLERMFEKHIQMSPRHYIREKRLVLALKLLNEGKSVTETFLQCGFSDCSSFINTFKRKFNITPYQYKKDSKKIKKMDLSI